jgi:nickel-dependent lactate racemase
MVAPTSKIAVIVDDITRPTPTHVMLPPLLLELETAGVPSRNVTILFATGSHRGHTLEERERLIGADVVRRYRTVDHDARDEASLVSLGTTSFGTPVKMNRLAVEADLRILLGLVKPHHQAGYSGGGKALLPGVCGLETIYNNHGYRALAHPRSLLGVIDGNPVRMDIEEMATRLVGPCFLLNVVINPHKEIVAAFAGQIIAAHRAAAQELDTYVRVSVPRQADIVITACGGFPSDISLYQGANAMSAPLRLERPVRRQDGVHILVGEFREGVGSDAWIKIVEEAGTPQAMLERVRTSTHFFANQDSGQMWASYVTHGPVIVVTGGIAPETLRLMWAEHAPTVEQALERAEQYVGHAASILVMPFAPYTIATLP